MEDCMVIGMQTNTAWSEAKALRGFQDTPFSIWLEAPGHM